MGADPVGERLGPGGLGIGKVAGAEHCDEHGGISNLTG
jgi:hypothetical protein